MRSDIKIQYVDLDSIRKEFLKYAPCYAIQEAEIALEKILDLQSQGLIRNGLYYVVLADIVGSTKYAAQYGDKVNAERIKHFVTSAFKAIGNTDLTNNAIFIKEIGDAVLIIFQCFIDVLKWHANFEEWLKIYSTAKGKKHKINIRTCIHIGDIILHGINPISLAVSQLFKMEKSVSAEEIVLTEPAYFTAWPTLARAYHAFCKCGTITLDGYKKPVSLYKVVINSGETAEDIAKESFE